MEASHVICETTKPDGQWGLKEDHDPENTKIQFSVIKHSCLAQWAHVFLYFQNHTFFLLFLQSRISSFYFKILARGSQLLPPAWSLPQPPPPLHCLSCSGLIFHQPSVSHIWLLFPGLALRLVFHGGCNKLPQTQWLKMTQIYSLAVPEMRNLPLVSLG